MKKLFGWSFLGLLGSGALLAVGAALSYVIAQTELGKWMVGLLLVYGGTMVAGAVLYDTTSGVVTEVHRLDPPTSFSAGSVRFRYTDAAGSEQTAFRRIMYTTPRFERLQEGDPILVNICRSDPEFVMLIGYGSHEPGRCERPEASP